MTTMSKRVGAALLLSSAAVQQGSAFVGPSSTLSNVRNRGPVSRGEKIHPRVGSPSFLREQKLQNKLRCNLFDLEKMGFENPFDPKRPTEKTTFKDVAGVDEAKQSLQEVVEFLKDPGKFAKMGAKIPRGVLLTGPPGTGKTLLAKAVAGEAGVPFYSASGSGFVEMFVGRGAARVRSLFDKAKKTAPAIVFIDEIDAMGKKRTVDSPNGGNDEREQTLNELLTQMDGFEGETGVIVLAATNRPDTLDDALVRAGRFDRTVVVGLPQRAGRESILEVHARNKPVAKEVDFAQIAKRTPGFSGAALENLLNEAAILAVRRNKSEISMEEINDAIDHVIAGPQKVDHFVSEERKRLVAVHEAGHAIVAHCSPESDDVSRISIVPRGMAAGLTWFTPNEQVLDSGLATRQYLKSQMAVALGGRIAERLLYGHDGVTTGASNDLQRVTSIARQMVERFGMSTLGQLSLEPPSAFLKSHSEHLAQEIDKQVLKIAAEAFCEAEKILTQNRDKLERIADRLVENETIEGDEFRELMDGVSKQKGGGSSGGGLRHLKAAFDPWQYL